MKPTTKVAFGVRAHTGWAVLVAVAGPVARPRILYRMRLELCDGSFPRFVYHAAANVSTAEAHNLVLSAKKASRQAAAEGISVALKTLSEAGGRVTVGVVLVSLRKAPAVLADILVSHPLIHTAEGELYRAALLAGCKQGKVAARTLPERELWEMAGKALRMSDAALRRRLNGLGRAAGHPWGQDQKLAALAALIGLAGK